MESLLSIKDEFSLSFFGRSYSLALAAHQCVCCGGRAEEFRDEVSAEEYLTSALCQPCQNKIFEEIEKDPLDSDEPF